MTLIQAFRFRMRDLIAIALFLMGAVAANAQEKPKETTKPEEKLTEVVITGSRIARPELDRRSRRSSWARSPSTSAATPTSVRR